LVDDHYRLLSAARSLGHLAQSGAAGPEDLRERAGVLAERLDAHETAERALAEAARGGAVHPPA